MLGCWKWQHVFRTVVINTRYDKTVISKHKVRPKCKFKNSIYDHTVIKNENFTVQYVYKTLYTDYFTEDLNSLPKMSIENTNILKLGF